MTQYNHFNFLKLDPIGEFYFILNKICKSIYTLLTAFIVKNILKLGGGKIWETRKVSWYSYH